MAKRDIKFWELRARDFEKMCRRIVASKDFPESKLKEQARDLLRRKGFGSLRL
ncbi:MAG: hypothetical protein ACYTEQ_30995 [Planctomycetota bacterium]|jgi:hypothetical protein